MLTRKLFDVVGAEGLLLLVAVALVQWGAGAPAMASVIRFYPVAVLAAGALLAWRFQRGRLLLALLGLVIADRAMLWLAPLDSVAPYADATIVRTVAILLATSLAALAFVEERGVLSSVGLQRLAVLGALTAVVLLVWLSSDFSSRAVAHTLDVTLIATPVLAGLPLGQPTSLVVLLALVALVGRALWHADAEHRGFLWAGIACMIAVSAGPAGGRATLHLATAGLVLVVATVESAYTLAYHDELTGLPARRALNEALQRVSGTYTVAMVDVDHFKKFNDTHGHDVGDQVLRMVAGRLERVTGGGRAFRYGGEEFAVLFPGKTAEESAPHLEALRTAVAESSFKVRKQVARKRKSSSSRATPPGGRQLAVTVSIGVAQAQGAALPDAVVKAADKALYRAKEDGRNRVALG